MEKTKVTRKGQTTIPSSLRKKYGIKEATMLVQDAGRAIVMIPLMDAEQLAGMDIGRYDARKIKREVDRLRRNGARRPPGHKVHPPPPIE